jgi:hypothetical protein
MMCAARIFCPSRDKTCSSNHSRKHRDLRTSALAGPLLEWKSEGKLETKGRPNPRRIVTQEERSPELHRVSRDGVSKRLPDTTYAHAREIPSVTGYCAPEPSAARPRA